MEKRLLICGYGRHGKDEIAASLHNQGCLRYVGSLSWFALPEMSRRLRVPPQQAWEERHQNRALWFTALNELRNGDPLFLVRRALLEGNLVTGVRSREELDGVKASGLFDRILWVNRPGYPADSTVCFGPGDCTDVIENDGTLFELHRKALQFARFNGYVEFQP